MQAIARANGSEGHAEFPADQTGVVRVQLEPDPHLAIVVRSAVAHHRRCLSARVLAGGRRRVDDPLGLRIDEDPRDP